LDGRDSSDPDGDNLTYSWQQTDDTGIVIPFSKNSAVTSFVAPLVEQDTTLSFTLTVSDGTTTHSDVTNVIISNVSGSSTLPLITNPFPDDRDYFGYAVSGVGNDGAIIVGTPFEDLVEFPDVSSLTLSEIVSKKTFSFRDDGNSIAYLADMDNPDSRFAVKSFSVEINSDDLMSLNLFSNHTTGLLSLKDNSGNILAATHDTIQQNDITTLGHTAHNGIIAFTSITTNSTTLFDGITGIPLAQVAQNAGAAYLYDGKGDLIRAIPNPSTGSSDQFGHTLTPFGTSGFVVGAIESDISTTNAGAAYVYDTISDSAPTVLTANNGLSGDEFGYAIATDGEIIIIGSPEAANGGFVTIFDGMTGTRLHTIPNPTGKNGDDFGESVAINNNSIIVGAPFDDGTSNSAGTVYLYEKSTPYSQTAQLDYTGHSPFSYFGKTMAVNNDIIAVGATGVINGGISSGSVYVFGNNGTLLDTIPNPAPKNGDRFGESISMSDEYLLIGNSKADNSNATTAGATYLYDTTSFLQLYQITNLHPNTGDSFGASVFVINDTFVVGAPNDQNDSFINSGSAYLFSESNFFGMNHPPIAFAGNDKTVTQGDTVILNGTGSVDPDGDSLSYFWNQTSGTIITLNDTAIPSEKQFVSYNVTRPVNL
jgi:hypothetical protein